MNKPMLTNCLEGMGVDQYQCGMTPDLAIEFENLVKASGAVSETAYLNKLLREHVYEKCGMVLRTDSQKQEPVQYARGETPHIQHVDELGAVSGEIEKPPMKMKHWEEAENSISFSGTNVVCIVKESDGRITFEEEAEHWHQTTMSKEEAKAALLEAIAWIDR